MICKKCGKETGSDLDICKTCQAETATPAETTELVLDEIKNTLNPTSAVGNIQNAMNDSVEEPEDSPKYCFKKSLTGTILAGIAMIILGIVSFCNGINLSLKTDGVTAAMLVGSIFCIVFALAALGLTVPALVIGIKNVIRTAKRLNKPVKPIAPFVLSCVAIVISLSNIGMAISTIIMSMQALIV